MSSEISKTYLCSERLDLIESTLNGAGFAKTSPLYGRYAAFLIGKMEHGPHNRLELTLTLQRHHGAAQLKRCHGIAIRFHRYAIQGLV